MASNDDALMKPSEVAELFSVHTKTVARWAKTGHIRSVITPGGHRRFYREDVLNLLARGEKQ